MASNENYRRKYTGTYHITSIKYNYNITLVLVALVMISSDLGHEVPAFSTSTITTWSQTWGSIMNYKLHVKFFPLFKYELISFR
jgi:hypothetical protein